MIEQWIQENLTFIVPGLFFGAMIIVFVGDVLFGWLDDPRPAKKGR